MKAQSGLETFIAVSIVIVILISSLVAYKIKNSEVEFTRVYFAAQNICFETKNIINQISVDGSGTAVKFSVPSMLENSDFNLTVNSTGKIIIVEWNSNLYSCTIITQNVTNSSYPIFLINKGDNVVRNSNGVVIIEKA